MSKWNVILQVIDDWNYNNWAVMEMLNQWVCEIFWSDSASLVDDILDDVPCWVLLKNAELPDHYKRWDNLTIDWVLEHIWFRFVEIVETENDSVSNIKNAKVRINEEEKRIQDSMRVLQEQALLLTKEAYIRVYGSEIPFPQWDCNSAIPSTWDNVRLDFEICVEDISRDLKEKYGDSSVVDKETGVSFFWYHTEWPVKGNGLQVRVPLNKLSPEGIASIL